MIHTPRFSCDLISPYALLDYHCDVPLRLSTLKLLIDFLLLNFMFCSFYFSKEIFCFNIFLKCSDIFRFFVVIVSSN